MPFSFKRFLARILNKFRPRKRRRVTVQYLL
jgi:hypothetical protein